MKTIIIILLLLSLIGPALSAQGPPKPYGPLPTSAQLKWQEMEMYCLIHFGVDTYTDKEWGYGDENPAILNPVHFDAAQIVGAAKAGGFKGIVVVAKHHDGLCLWPTKTTGHNISKSPFRNGKGDMIKEYEQACQKMGMQLGLYCSPWDRNNPTYGTREYVNIYRAQLRELYSHYGPLFISWHDGANGGDGFYGGSRDTRTIDRTNYYGWDTTWAITRKMQSSAVIFGDVGPDIRWVGNEEGHAGETSWETYTPLAPDEGKRPGNGYVKYWEATEGHRNGKYWMPAECDVPLRPGWFYHPSQDGKAKSPYVLLDLYYKSVGRGADLDLGIAPNREGLLSADDVNVLKQFGDLLKEIFRTNLAKGAVLTATNVRANDKKKYGPSFLTDIDRYSYWATDDNVLTPQLVVDLGKVQTFNVIRLRENIKLGQRINALAVDALLNKGWQEIATATSIGANRLIRLPQNITTSKVRLRVTSAAACVALSDFGLFKEPSHLTAPVISRDKNGMVKFTTEAPVARIRYTLDGTNPSVNSLFYMKPFLLADGGLLKVRSFDENNKGSETSEKQFGLAKKGWQVTSSNIAVKRNESANAIDEDEHTLLSTLKDSDAQFPQEIIVDMGKLQSIKAFTYLPRQDGKKEGIADKFSFSTSDDGIHWQLAATGEFSNISANPVEQTVQASQSVEARYFKFSILHVVSGNGITIAELGILLGN